MKKALLLFVLGLFAVQSYAQDCSRIFISEYVEGYGNNKALEIYNPTDQAVNLSNYSVARFSNGSTTASPETSTPAYTVTLPDVMLQPYDVYVIVIDKTDYSSWNTSLEKPVWNGYNVIDTLFDVVSGLPLLDNDGNVRYGPVYEDIPNVGPCAVFGDVYNEVFDLYGKADTFLCPSYAVNRAMYFNGDDAVVLLEGKEVDGTGSNILDVIGVIGIDPGTTWIGVDSFPLTKDQTLVRKREIKDGRYQPGEIIDALGGTFLGLGWNSYRKNSFCSLGVHICDCDPDPPVSGTTTDCTYTGPASVNKINEVEFTMSPNPIDEGLVSISSAERIEGYSMLNLMGQAFNTESFNASQREVSISVEGLQKGIYFVKVQFEGNRISIKKLIKQ